MNCDILTKGHNPKLYKLSGHSRTRQKQFNQKTGILNYRNTLPVDNVNAVLVNNFTNHLDKPWIEHMFSLEQPLRPLASC